MYQHLLVVLEPESTEQKALSRALHIASLQPTRLTLFISIYDFAYEMTTMLSGEEREQMRHSLIEDRIQWMKDLLEDYETDEQVITLEVVWHHRPFEAIIRFALKNDVDLIVKGTHKHDTLHSVIFTPTDWSLLRKSACPVLLVKDHGWPEHGQVLAAVHAASDSDTHQALNKRIIEAAHYMSNKLNSSLHLVNCHPGAPTSIAVEIPEFDSRHYQTSVREFHQKALTAASQAVDRDYAGLHIREGMPEDEIPALAKEIDAELVVLGTIGRTGISAALLGNTAEHVIEQLNCDLLAVKPPGFTSPLAD
ncbi:MAG: universal stress protein UspE [Idiomarina sp.]|nr:universal stress protein UspE [Idiomarina sp.]